MFGGRTLAPRTSTPTATATALSMPPTTASGALTWVTHFLAQPPQALASAFQNRPPLSFLSPSPRFSAVADRAAMHRAQLAIAQHAGGRPRRRPPANESRPLRARRSPDR